MPPKLYRLASRQVKQGGDGLIPTTGFDGLDLRQQCLDIVL